ncbi:DUF502 domain-containing protein [Permianibacter sp. IMCC34836]|uniref:DUF502 domain-containing protein n=1 Tax=Permianibacter fluminis TaxID=2738515 RepID=UPI0015545234|nr:DUF502 domain-containing protein [Permianibacter fluminis]NQD38304.1 DUF502 domain-containing protein [Permianibacter fluminis]
MKPKLTVLRNNLLVGVAVMLPITIILMFLRWLYHSTTQLIRPITELVVAQSGLGPWLADFIVIALIVVMLLLVGLVVRTRIGGFLLGLIEQTLFKNIPGYQLVKETVGQFVATDRPSPFSKVALVRLFGDEVSTTAFITAEHENGYFTVFVPTGPNPTSGLMFHVPADRVRILEGISIETAMRTVIGCGVGAQPILKAGQE